MKGRSRFSAAEADEIRGLLREIRHSERATQKRLRDRLRGIGFYITDFATDQRGFTAADFDILVSNGSVRVD